MPRVLSQLTECFYLGRRSRETLLSGPLLADPIFVSGPVPSAYVSRAYVGLSLSRSLPFHLCSWLPALLAEPFLHASIQ